LTVSLRPNAEGTGGAWHRESGAVDNIHRSLDGDTDEYVQTAMLNASRPKRFLLVITDDHRGIHGGEFYFTPEVQSRVIDVGVTFRYHYADRSKCSPARHSMFTAWQYNTHLIDIGTTVKNPSLYQYGVQGKTVGAETIGPWEKQLGPGEERYLGEDVELFTGQIFNWVRDAGVTTSIIGKYQNAHARSYVVGGVDYGSLDGSGTPIGPTDAPFGARRIPPDIDYACIKVGGAGASLGDPTGWDGGDQDSYTEWYCEKFEDDTSNIGTNTDTEGAVAQHTYKKSITSGTYANVGGQGVATIVVQDHGVDPDDFTSKMIIVRSASVSLYNTNETEVEATVIDDDTLQYNTLTSPASGSALGASGFCYPKRWYATAFMSDKLFEFLNRRADDEPWFCVMAIDAPHQGTSDAFEVEQKYVGAVSSADAFYHEGVPGAYADTVTSSDTNFNPAKSQWLQRMETLMSLDDMIARIDDYLTARGWEDTVIMIVGDQGCHYGEHGIWKNNGGEWFAKQTAYAPSANAPCVIRYPDCNPGSTYEGPSHHSDVACTVLDWFGLTTHFAHTKRDGTSLFRRLEGTNDTQGFFLSHESTTSDDADAFISEADYQGSGKLYKWFEAWPVGAGAATVDAECFVDQLYDLTTNGDEHPTLDGGNLLTVGTAPQIAAATVIANDLRDRALASKVARGDDFRNG
jgi:arylsulfatase A-like enzyme